MLSKVDNPLILKLSGAILGFQLLLLGAVATEAYLLASEVDGLKQEIAATSPSEGPSVLAPECEKAIWPNIPLHCLERVSARETVRALF